MEKCEQCGNHSHYWFVMEQNGQRHIFDSFECAIFALAPACSHCGCRILGHGFQNDTPAANGDLEEIDIYCCAHCADERRRALSVESGSGT